MKKYNGFTLIELMVVVAIIGVISAIAYPSYNSYMNKSRRADAKVGLQKLADKQERFYLQNNTYTSVFTSAGLNTSTTSEEGYYTFAVDSASVSGFSMTATAVGIQANDIDCATLTLSSTSLKTATAGSGGDATKCW